MGILDKIFGGNSNTGGVSSAINKEVDEAHMLREKSERELQLLKQAGEDVAPWCIDESRSKGFPYDCHFDWEVEMVEKALSATDTLQGILDINSAAWNYLSIAKRDFEPDSELQGFYKNHACVWVEDLSKRASQGSIYAKAALVKNPVENNIPELVELIIEKVNSDVLEGYKTDLENAVSVNDRNALSAYAFFILTGDSNKEARKEMFLRAGQMGLSEAYKWLFFESEGDHWSSEEGFRYAVAAAECNDGPEAYWFQDKLGDAFYYVEGWVKTQDKEQALYWYKKAAGNGYRISISTLEMLKKNGEI